MNNDLVTGVTEEIKTLHYQILDNCKTTLDKAIRIGELLQQQKEALGHGRFLPWVKENLPFSRQTAASYIRLYQHRDNLNVNQSLHLTDAKKLLSVKKEANHKAQGGKKKSRHSTIHPEDDLPWWPTASIEARTFITSLLEVMEQIENCPPSEDWTREAFDYATDLAQNIIEILKYFIQDTDKSFIGSFY
jgi:hypothetical protein